MTTRMGVFELLVLMAVKALGERASSVDIRRAVADSRGRDVSSGAVHTTLERLEARGLVVSRRGEATRERGGRPRRYFAVTAAGREAISVNVGALEQMLRVVRTATSRS